MEPQSSFLDIDNDKSNGGLMQRIGMPSLPKLQTKAVTQTKNDASSSRAEQAKRPKSAQKVSSQDGDSSKEAPSVASKFLSFRKRTKSTPSPPAAIPVPVEPMPTRASLPIASRFARADRASWQDAKSVTLDDIVRAGSSLSVSQAASAAVSTSSLVQSPPTLAVVERSGNDSPYPPSFAASDIPVEQSQPPEDLKADETSSNSSLKETSRQGRSTPVLARLPIAMKTMLPSSAPRITVVKLPEPQNTPAQLSIRVRFPLPVQDDSSKASLEASKERAASPGLLVSPQPAVELRSRTPSPAPLPDNGEPSPSRTPKRGREHPFPLRSVRSRGAQPATVGSEASTSRVPRVGFYLPVPVEDTQAPDASSRTTVYTDDGRDPDQDFLTVDGGIDYTLRRNRLIQNVESMLHVSPVPSITT